MDGSIYKEKISRYRRVLTVSAVMLLAACSSIKIGEDFDVQVFEGMVKVGVTTKAELEEKLGRPKSTGVATDKDGERMLEWVYFYASGKLPSMKNSNLKFLQVRFDKRNVLRSYNWSKGVN